MPKRAGYKSCLTKNTILANPIKGQPLKLYIPALDQSLGALLAQENVENTENALYYLRRALVGPEERYLPIKRCSGR